MMDLSKQLIAQIGETDQLFLENNSAELALERANLRLQLVFESHFRQEQVHFLQEAIVLLEQARIEYEAEISLRLYLDLSLTLAKAYMVYFELTKEQRFALITQQVLKPLAHHQDGDIYFFLAYASAVKKESSLTQHWLNKYSQTAEFNLELLQQHPAFANLRQTTWFSNMIKRKAH